MSRPPPTPTSKPAPGSHASSAPRQTKARGRRCTPEAAAAWLKRLPPGTRLGAHPAVAALAATDAALAGALAASASFYAAGGDSDGGADGGGAGAGAAGDDELGRALAAEARDCLLPSWVLAVRRNRVHFLPAHVEPFSQDASPIDALLRPLRAAAYALALPDGADGAEVTEHSRAARARRAVRVAVPRAAEQRVEVVGVDGHAAVRGRAVLVQQQQLAEQQPERAERRLDNVLPDHHHDRLRRVLERIVGRHRGPAGCVHDPEQRVRPRVHVQRAQLRKRAAPVRLVSERVRLVRGAGRGVSD